MGKIGNIALCLPLLGGLGIHPVEPFLRHSRGDLQADPPGRVASFAGVTYRAIRSARRVCMGSPGLHGVSTPRCALLVVAYAPLRGERPVCMASPRPLGSLLGALSLAGRSGGGGEGSWGCPRLMGVSSRPTRSLTAGSETGVLIHAGSADPRGSSRARSSPRSRLSGRPGTFSRVSGSSLYSVASHSAM